MRTLLRVLLPVACVAWIAFILSNSLQSGEQSSAQSATIVDEIQRIVKIVAPNSAIANATGAAYDRLHESIRRCAHFAQFALLGGLLGWTYFSYTFRYKHFYLPILGVLLFPVLDEYIQGFVAGRSLELLDLALDICGGMSGILFAVLTVIIGLMIYIKKTNKHTMYENKG